MGVSIRAPTMEDILHLAANMRGPDAMEVRASTGDEPFESVLTRCVEQSAEVYAVDIDNELASLWGVWPTVAPAQGRVGVGWVLSTDVIERKAKAWWWACKAIFPVLLERWDIIISAIDVRHTQSLQWAHRLGAHFGSVTPLGINGEPFQWFRITKGELRV